MWKVMARDWRKLECTADGAVRSLRFHLNNLVGSIPPELSWLSNSLILLDVGSNNLTGPVFNELGLLTKLGGAVSLRKLVCWNIPIGDRKAD
jgi:hypothetical protein